jgi:hypothetical protein
MIRNTHDATTASPRLAVYLNLGTVGHLPEWSAGPRGEGRALLEAIKAAGFEGVQGGDGATARALGLGYCGDGRVNVVADADEVARRNKDAGAECATLHVAWGLEDDAAVDRLVGAILDASARHDIPLYIETHRATITQDIWRTVELTRRFPQVRFNGDFSHWYTGLEMVYGGIDTKLAFMRPVLDRVRFIHGRIGNPGSMQVAVAPEPDGTWPSYVQHFQAMWTAAMRGFLADAGPGDYLVFAPELLHPQIFYARTFDGREECDRWEQALLYARIARECWEQAALQ